MPHAILKKRCRSYGTTQAAGMAFMHQIRLLRNINAHSLLSISER